MDRKMIFEYLRACDKRVSDSFFNTGMDTINRMLLKYLPSETPLHEISGLSDRIHELIEDTWHQQEKNNAGR